MYGGLCMDVRVPVQSSSFDHSRNDTFDHDELITSLRKYISKNKVFPSFFEECQSGDHDDVLNILKDAINRFNPGSQIFTHPDCMRYLIYLIESKQVPFWHGMTVYAYLMAVHEFGIKNVTFDRLVSDDRKEISAFGKAYFEKFFIKSNIIFKINANEFYQFILSLPFIDQHVMTIKKVNNLTSQSKLFNILAVNIPFVVVNVGSKKSNMSLFSEEKIYCSISSVTVMNHLNSLMSDKPIKMMPIFGSVFSTLSFHQRSYHPVAVSSPDVKSNLANVHGKESGYFLTWLHDVGHIYWANMLTSQERDILFHRCIPELNSLKLKYKNDDVMLTTIDKLIYHLNDFDLTPIHFFDKGNRFQRYLLICLRSAHITHKTVTADLSVDMLITIVDDYAKARLSSDNSSPAV